MPPQTESVGHDIVGNRIQDGRWEMAWDGENRLIDVRTRAAAVSEGIPQQRLRYAYDGDGRLIERRRFSWSAGNWVLSETTRYLNDGWQCVAEFNGSNTLQRRQVWGLDLDGSRGGMGGIGGLLWIVSGANGTHYATSDGSGNVVGLFDTSGSISARYVYSPFGELLQLSGGTIATENPWRFSSKRQDPTTDWIHYEFRIYDSASGRWLSRDPIGEAGGENLYGFVGNDPVNRVDLWGFECSGATCGGESAWMTQARYWAKQKDRLQAQIDSSDSPMAVLGQFALELGDVATNLTVVGFDAQRIRIQELYCQGGLQAVAEDAYAQLEEMAGTADWVRVADYEDQYSVGERVWFGVQGSAKSFLAVVGAHGAVKAGPAGPGPGGQAASVPSSGFKGPPGGAKVCGPEAPRPPPSPELQCAPTAGGGLKPGQFHDKQGKLRNANGRFARTGKPPSPSFCTAKARRAWEQAKGKPWPTDPRLGRPFDVHHVQRRADGGALYNPDNIIPVHPEMHRRVHHRNSGLYPPQK